MSSTTSSKKEIVDFLWEWAESRGNWGKLLINKIAGTEEALNVAERQEVFDYFLGSLGLKDGLKAISFAKPLYTPTDKLLELETLSDVTGVNRLAKGQIINFSPNLTVIFGENGTGKTGYGRILKSLGFSYDTNNKIIKNIYGAQEDTTATIKYKANGISDTFEWKGISNNAALNNISVFNNNCVQISLADRELIVSPIGFHLFSIASAELNQLNSMLANKINSYDTSLNWSGMLNLGTAQHKFIINVSGASTEDELVKLAQFDDAMDKQLTDLKSELQGLNRKLLETSIQQQGAIIHELESAKSKITTSKAVLNKLAWEGMIDLNKKIKDMEALTRIGIKDIAESNGIEFYERPQFQDFIKAAESYIQTLNTEGYPGSKDKCVYCYQPLSDQAMELLSSYRKLLNDKSQEELDTLKLQKKELVDSVRILDDNLVFHQATFGINEDLSHKQPLEMLTYNKLFSKFKNLFIEDNVTEGSTFNLEYQTYIDFLSLTIDKFKESLAKKKEDLLNLSARETELKGKISELTDRKLLSAKIADVRAAIKNHKTVAILSASASNFNTTAISKKTTQARDELVSADFEDIFKKELKAFGKSHINIDLNLGTDKGTSKIKHRINSHSLTDILSEGEQKAIALAEFLAELQLDNIKAPVIFDDPVNSLDHHIIDDVARRLLKLSRERQVVVFTHSVLLFNSFLYFSRTSPFSGITCKLYNSRNEYDTTGFITEAEELNNVTTYIKKINVLLGNTSKDRAEAEVAGDGYGYLRSCIELLVEHEIFQGTVKRYQKNVALTLFGKVNGAKLDAHKDKLYELFERCSGFIKGHSNPAEIVHEPTITGLKSDFEEFKVIRAAFLN